MRTRTLGSLTAAVLLSGTLLFTGCGDDDDGGTSPTGGNDTTVPQSIAEEQVGTTVTLATDLVNSVQGLSTAGSSALDGLGGGLFPFKKAAALDPTESKTYDDEAGQWDYTYVETFTEGDSAFDIDMTGTLQFFDIMGEPQQEPDDASTSMSYDIDAVFGVDLTFTDPQSGNTTSSSLDMEYVAQTTVTGLNTGTLAVVSDGSQTVNTSTTTNQGTSAYDFSMDWNMDVAAPTTTGGCPTGTVTLDFAQWSVAVTYDGAPSASRQLLDGGVPVARATETLPCGGITATSLD